MIIKIDPPTIVIQNPDGERFVLNEYEFHHLRVQIRKTKAEGWKWIQTDKFEHDIDCNGKMWYYPPQFDMITNYLMELF